MVKMNKKRGQAALEFLTTYGWAFMVILVMIGALAYFGILSPDRFLPQRCNVGPEFSCDEFVAIRVDEDFGGQTSLKVRFTNTLGQTIEVNDITRASHPQQTLENPSTSCDWSSGQILAGNPVEINCTFSPDFSPPPGAKMKFTLDMLYTPVGRTFQQPLTAEIFVTLQP